MSVVDGVVDFGFRCIGGGAMLSIPIILFWSVLICDGYIEHLANEYFEEEEQETITKVEEIYFARYPKGLKRFNDKMNSFKENNAKRVPLLTIINDSKKSYIEKVALSEQLKNNRKICDRCNLIKYRKENPKTHFPSGIKGLLYKMEKESKEYENTTCICDSYNDANIEFEKRDFFTAVKDYENNQYNIVCCLFQLLEEEKIIDTLLFHIKELFKAGKLMYKIDENCMEDLHVEEIEKWLNCSGIPKDKYEETISYYK